MSETHINYFSEDCDFTFQFSNLFKPVLEYLGKTESVILSKINYIFCSDMFLLAKNKQFLNHDYFTDVITFDYSDNETISGDIFISIDTVKSNSNAYGVSFENELFRVMIHGCLHLVGYGDSTDEEQKVMRSKEDFYLSQISIF